MRVSGFITGTIGDDPKIVTPQGQGKSFLAFTVESPDSYSQYPNRVKCAIYGKDVEAAKEKLFKGATVTVQGDVSAEAYMSTRTNPPKPMGALRMFVRSFEIFGGSKDTAPAKKTQPAPASAPADPAPASDDDVPF
jgi:single-stranded DNA-binding protein